MVIRPTGGDPSAERAKAAAGASASEGGGEASSHAAAQPHGAARAVLGALIPRVKLAPVDDPPGQRLSGQFLGVGWHVTAYTGKTGVAKDAPDTEVRAAGMTMGFSVDNPLTGSPLIELAGPDLRMTLRRSPDPSFTEQNEASFFSIASSVAEADPKWQNNNFKEAYNALKLIWVQADSLPLARAKACRMHTALTASIVTLDESARENEFDRLAQVLKQKMAWCRECEPMGIRGPSYAALVLALSALPEPARAQRVATVVDALKTATPPQRQLAISTLQKLIQIDSKRKEPLMQKYGDAAIALLKTLIDQIENEKA